MSYKNIKLKTSVLTQNEDFELSDRSYSVLDVQHYLEYITKKHGTFIDNPPVKTYVNKLENRITFKIRTGYNLEFRTSKEIKLLESTKSNSTKDKNGENVPRLETTKIVLNHCNIVTKDYQQDSRVLYIFVPNKSFSQLLNISPKNFIFLKTFNSEFSFVEVWFADCNSKLLEKEDYFSYLLKCKI